MSRIVILRNGDNYYVTDRQAEAMFSAINSNPNLRIIKVLTGTGYRYTSPSAIIDMKKGLGEDYRSDAVIIEDQRRALRELQANAQLKLRPGDDDGTIGLLEEHN